ncbi:MULTISPECIES: cupin domain-containing protein [Achromobacter]|uniref:Cupin domain-containing protein n=1 Tax=Achromobacter spanius TaxID=217203 RepID=A0ABY8GLP5_9BURK|nr:MULTISPECIES: cupin domain-containing protein [Achromobacter]WAI85197.1 cupin domain-containing protein [Achromobacter spanius]WEX95279.1 cupin domain-containing protein [Achromobacter sp. SS2-2022]WFP05551.1 cupin domain-containing protein [Achromobacter spanius]
MSKITKFGLPFLAASALLSPLADAAAPGHPATPADAIVTELMTKALPDIPGKDAVMITVDYPPGAVDPVHRHDAYSFVYVLEGSIVMQVKGGKEVTLTPGQTFFEGPDDIHTVGRNASQTQPAKFVVVLIKKKGAPILTPIQ